MPLPMRSITLARRSVNSAGLNASVKPNWARSPSAGTDSRQTRPTANARRMTFLRVVSLRLYPVAFPDAFLAHELLDGVRVDRHLRGEVLDPGLGDQGGVLDADIDVLVRNRERRLEREDHAGLKNLERHVHVVH